MLQNRPRSTTAVIRMRSDRVSGRGKCRQKNRSRVVGMGVRIGAIDKMRRRNKQGAGGIFGWAVISRDRRWNNREGERKRQRLEEHRQRGAGEVKLHLKRRGKRGCRCAC